MRSEEQIIESGIKVFRNLSNLLERIKKIFPELDEESRFFLKQLTSSINKGEILAAHTISLILKEVNEDVGSIIQKNLENILVENKKIMDDLNRHRSLGEIKNAISNKDFFKMSKESNGERVFVLNFDNFIEKMQKYDMKEFDVSKYIETAQKTRSENDEVSRNFFTKKM